MDEEILKIYDNIRVGILLTLVLLVIGLFFFSVNEIGSLITGAAVTQVFAYERFGYGCNITLSDGWNLISVPCESYNNSVALIFNASLLNYTSVHLYNASDPNDKWKAYNPALPSWVVQDLVLINTRYGYWIRANENITYSLNGSVTIPQYLSLFKGWNLVGYPINETRNVQDALTYIDGGYTIVWKYNESDATNWRYFVSPGSNTFSVMELAVGYWINATNNVTLKLDWSD